MQKKNKTILVVIAILLALLSFYFVNQYIISNNTTEIVQKDSVVVPTFEFGMRTDTFSIHKGEIKPNEIITNLLLKFNIPQQQIFEMVNKSKGVYDIERNFIAGKKYTFFSTKNSLHITQCFVYEPNSLEYIVFDLRDSIQVYKKKRPIKTEIKTAYGKINSSLYKTLQDANISPVLAIELSNIFAWTIDFYRIQKDDWFKVIYEEKFVDDKSVGVGKIIAAKFNHTGKIFEGHYFVQDGIVDYFDEKATSVKKAFLKSPLKFGRLSSGFTMKRFHPVQKINKAHLGTDYAAPTGTPILATGNGVVIASEYGVFNGNYVKIRHNNTYTTQYLHMSKRAAKVGEKVKQGDVIGYVGSTGLATGPHVCYRFWKNGQQTNHLKEDFPTAEPIQKQYRDSFNNVLKENNKNFDELDIKKNSSNKKSNFAKN